eukprot:CAMPEP_0185258654 /NCGR_PEP_ID=MMETSP1359-20130426/7545_1 /TAXON_ID=552665 /ORGANISM="Bigelowiella longifila, Strain CCMP242" /LENGTH=144 /DNA_ID=CAMNT_0027844229 /DNA_START=298 /DNA_END=732 /DNA_ORIENTATION=+
MRCMIASKWPAVKGGRTESRLDAMCGNLSKKAAEWSKLRTKVDAQEEEIRRLRRKLQAKEEGIGTIFNRRDEDSVPMSEVALPFGRMFIPTKALERKEEKGDFGANASASSARRFREAVGDEEKKKQRARSLEGLISTPGGMFT